MNISKPLVFLSKFFSTSTFILSYRWFGLNLNFEVPRGNCIERSKVYEKCKYQLAMCTCIYIDYGSRRMYAQTEYGSPYDRLN